MRRTLTISVLLLVLGGCATFESSESGYLDESGLNIFSKRLLDQGGFKAFARSEIYYNNNITQYFLGLSKSSQKEANQIALGRCKQSKRAIAVDITNNPESCYLVYIGNKRVSSESRSRLSYQESKTYSNGTYTGDFLNGKRHGKGIYRFNDGDVYEGDFVNNKKTGKGIYRFNNGDVYEGDFVDVKKHGKGIYKHRGGDVYEGEYKNDTANGYGLYMFANGNSIKGNWKNGYQAKGATEYFTNGEYFTHTKDYNHLTKEAYGRKVYSNGDVLEKAYFVNNKLISTNFMQGNGDTYKTQVKGDEIIVETNKRKPLETIGNILGGIINVTLGLALIAAELESGQSYSTAPTYKEVQDCKYMAPTKVRKDGTVGLGRYVCRTKKVRTN